MVVCHRFRLVYTAQVSLSDLTEVPVESLRRWSQCCAVVGGVLYMFGGYGGVKNARTADL